jgi:hypothetical protein
MRGQNEEAEKQYQKAPGLLDEKEHSSLMASANSFVSFRRSRRRIQPGTDSTASLFLLLLKFGLVDPNTISLNEIRA